YSRVELPGTAPDLDVGLLDDLLRQIGSAQDTQHHPIEFPTGCRVEPFKRGLVAAADGGEEPDEFGWRQHGATTPCPVSGPRSTSRLSPPDTGSVERRNYAPGGGFAPRPPQTMGLDSGRRDAAQPHGADGVELGLLTGGLLGALALLVALVQQF